MIKKICSVLSMVVFLGLLVIAGFLFVPKMLGYDEYAVLSGSMEPGIPVGAIVYDKNFTGSEARDGVVVISKHFRDKQKACDHKQSKKYHH
jgi:signal peptidase